MSLLVERSHPLAPHERQALVDLLTWFDYCLDTKDFEGYARCFTPDGVLSLPSGEVRAPDVAEFVRRDLGRFDRTHHMTGNHIFETGGKGVRLRANLLAVHRHGADTRSHWDVGAVYHCVCEHTDDGWRFARVELKVVWENGRADPASRMAGPAHQQDGDH
ncbi:nuclear transport factor 2 family protein [Embleya sp. NPDC056538]|uniref:nuclear transport factor 2 family protein n=1 Tax=Embleya sp. NPDC056538 TaxID=3345858 RepID=UPI0036871FCF